MKVVSHYQTAVVFFSILLTSLTGQSFQKSIVAGYFYPADSVELKSMLKKFYDRVPEHKIDGKIHALISPHAGYIYSGQVAGYGYKAAKNQKYDCVILIGPSHHFGQGGVAVDQRDGHQTPLGIVSFDKPLAQKFLNRKGIFSSRVDVLNKEHSIEVQLPFLQTAFASKNLKIVEIVMLNQDLTTAQTLAQAITENTKGRNVLIVASSDLSHYHSYQEAKKLDQRVINSIKELNEKQLYQDLKSNQCEACGGGPILTAIIAARSMGANASEILYYSNSGDVTGDSSAVVGYLSAVIYKKEVGMDLGLKDSDKQTLHAIARKAVEKAAVNNNITAQEVLKNFKNIPERLKEPNGVFVTLKIEGMLRGCIGRLIADRPLYEVTAEMAIAAATQDPRFRPVKKEEVKHIEIDISVLTPLKKIDNLSDIEVGRDGLLIRQGIFSGVLLPQVATEQGWDKITFLEETCIKAGLYKDAWKEKNTEIFIFSAQIF